MKHAAFAMICIASTIFAPSAQAATPTVGATTHRPAVADFGDQVGWDIEAQGGNPNIILSDISFQAGGEQPLAQIAASNPNYAMSSFALRDKAGHRQLHMISPMEANTGSNMEELCIPDSRICLLIVPRHEEVDCNADSDVCDRIPVTTDEVQMTLRVRQNFADNEQVPNEIHYIPLNIDIADPQAVILWPLATISANVPMTAHTPGSVTIGVISMKETRVEDGSAAVQRFHLLRLDELGSHEVTATEILSAVKSLQLCRKVSAAEHPEECRMTRAAMGMLALDIENKGPSPTFEYFLGGGTVGSLTTMLTEMETIEKLSDLHGKDIIKLDQCYVMRKLAMDPVSGRYEFDSPMPNCRFLSVED
jgi:hypothetical protein